METTLIYFSASGNSLSLTHKLAKELGNCEIISIAKEIRNEEVKVKTPKVGFIFPIYAWGLPRIVSDFVQKLKIPHGSYVFAVATCVAIPGNTLKELKTTLGKNEINLNSGFVTRAESASLMKMNALDNMIKFLDTKRNKIKYVNDRIHEIVDCIKKEKNMAPETSNWSAGVFGSAFHRMGIKAFKTKGSEFTINEDCSKCGTCLKVCPRNNIELLETGPKFNNDCELCHACIQWCPKFAIRHSDFDPLRKQYRNPNIVLSEIMTN